MYVSCGDYSQFPVLMHQWAMPDSQGGGVYCEKVWNSFRESAIMALDAVEQETEQVPVDDFQALEDKVYRTIERYKAARQAQAAAERDAQRVRQQLEERDEQLVALRREAVQLRKEREEIRGRVEKMLEQIESIGEERAS
jgi:chromosome segregation ATPase